MKDKKFVTDISTKANIFNKFFAEQCTPLKNGSVLPSSQEFLIRERLCSLDFSNDEILKLIRSLNVHKAHGHDDIPITMIKLCDKSLVKSLIISFQDSIKLSHYPDIWRKSNVIPAHKKSDKQLIKNYRLSSLLPLFGKIFEKVVFNRIYNFLLNERLLNPNQSRFRPSDSCINQVHAITHDIFKSFDSNPSLEVRSDFIDISKTSDTIWNKVYFTHLNLGVSQANLMN